MANRVERMRSIRLIGEIRIVQTAQKSDIIHKVTTFIRIKTQLKVLKMKKNSVEKFGSKRKTA